MNRFDARSSANLCVPYFLRNRICDQDRAPFGKAKNSAFPELAHILCRRSGGIKRPPLTIYKAIKYIKPGTALSRHFKRNYQKE
jgi:hypothetical protein